MYRKFILLGIFFILFHNGYGQNIQYQFSHLDITNGLSNNQVTAIFKDSRGFLWFGTLAGLNRYDGFKFKIFKSSEGDSTSLADDFIQSIEEGPGGKLWISTRFGFNVYDPKTEKFDRNVGNSLKALSIPWNALSSLYKDKRGNFWFVNANLGIYRYNLNTKKSTRLHYKRNSKASLYPNPVTNVKEDSKGYIWVIHNNGIIEKIDPRSNQIIYRSDSIKKRQSGELLNYVLSFDNKDDMWIYAIGSSIGVYYFKPTDSYLQHFSTSSDYRLNSDIVNHVVQDDKGLIWVATDHGGINLIDKKDFKVKYLVNREHDKKSLAQNSIISLFKDDSGIIWIGTFKRGLNYYHENIIKFPLIRNYASDKNSLNYDDVNRFVEDAKGNLWIGTNGGGLIYFDRKANKFSQFKHSNSKNSLSNDVVVSLCIDHEQKLWIGTYFGGLDCFDGKTFINYKHNPNNPLSISDNRVWEIFEDSSRNLWIGTLAGGLNRFDRTSKTFTHYNKYIRSGYTSSILEDKEGNLWFGSSIGINVLMKGSRRFKNYFHSNTDTNSLIHDNVSSMLLDSRGFIWAATREGLSMLNPKTGRFKNFRKENGLPDNIVVDILEDKNHNLWLSTLNGLSNLLITKNNKGVKSYVFKNYDESDGLQGLEFNESASLRTRKGELIFGGANGFNIFDPEVIQAGNSQPVLVLTDFQVFNKSVKPGTDIDGNSILKNAITEEKSVTLNYSQNVFSIEFAALNYFNLDKVKLQYMLQGFDKDWLTADNKVRKATYTNLDPGQYTFKVRATNEEGAFSDKHLSFMIKVLPPFYRTNLAYITYLLLIAGILYIIRKRGIKKIKTQFAIEQERQQARQMHELDMMKIKFFTNVSHEFRTPLSLILAPVDKMLKQPTEPEHMRQLQMINRNARRLLNLVNQLLDFRKMEVQELKLHPKRGDIIEFIKEISNSFSDVGEKKNIGFLFDSDCDSMEVQFDHDKIERILFNLLSNAFKFTPEKGHVSVLLNLINGSKENQKSLEINVIDTGIGIPIEKHEKIFERFFQNDVPGTMVNQGSGIGLSITKEFVKLHGGNIVVESQPNEGSCFTVTIPLKIYAITDSLSDAGISKQQQSLPTEIKQSNKKYTVLLVEDNDDFRFYLKDNLKESFHIMEAANGKEGWQKSLALHPNLVVSDISMPEMNGIDLCKKIKSDSRTSHIPVILLTALTGEEQQLKGLETGATDYMTKPFNFEILLSKIKNILLQQESMRKTYQKQVEIKPLDIVIDSPDELFLQKVLQVIEKNISNPDFSVEELSSEMFMSRVTLYKKLLAITGKTPVEFVRSFRIKRAATLLEKGHLTISQIAYKVGFKSQKYFVRSFKAEYDMLPSAYIEHIKLQPLEK